MDILQIILPLTVFKIVCASVGAVVAALVMAKFKKINDTLGEIYGTENDLKKRIEQYVAKVARDELSKMVEGYKIALESNNREIIESLKTVAEGQITTLASFIRSQEEIIAKQSEGVIGEVVKKAQADVEDYKKLQFDVIDLRVSEAVESLSRDILGRVVTHDEHEQLVWDALQKAKKQGIFREGMIKGHASLSRPLGNLDFNLKGEVK